MSSVETTPSDSARLEENHRTQTTRENIATPHSDDSDREAADREHPRDAGRTDGGLKGTLRKHPLAVGVCAALIVAGVIGGVAWYLHERHFERTDDAFIDGRPVLVSPQVTGSIVQVSVSDNQVVKTGDLLATIDPRDYQAAL